MRILLLLNFLILTPLFLMSQTDASMEQGSDSLKSYFTISHPAKHKTITVTQNTEVKLWTAGSKIKGKLLAANSRELFVIYDSDTLALAISDITKLRLYGGSFAKTGGIATMALGGFGMGFGALTTVVGTIGLINQDLSGVVIIFAPLLPAGYGLYVLGNRFYGRRFKLTDGWQIKL